MLSFFSTNNPAIVLLYLPVLFLLRAGLFIHPHVPVLHDAEGPLSQVLLPLLSGHVWLNTLLAALLTFIQALLINNMVNTHKMMPRKNYTVGLLYIVLLSWFYDGLFVTPALLGLTFFIAALHRLFALIKKDKLYLEVYDAGFFIASAALFYFPAVVWLVFLFLALGTVRALAWREWLIALLGLLSPLLLYFTVVFVFDVAYYRPFAHGWLQWPALTLLLKLQVVVFAFITMAVSVLLPGFLYSTVIQVRKFVTLLLTSYLFWAASFLALQVISPAHFSWIALPLSITGAMLLMAFRRKWIAELLFIILLLLVLVPQVISALQII